MRCIESIVEHIPGVATILVVSPDRPVPSDVCELMERECAAHLAREDGAIVMRWIDEGEAPFNTLMMKKSDISSALGSTGLEPAGTKDGTDTESNRTTSAEDRVGWYVQQVLKLRVFELLAACGTADSERCLVVDADCVFHLPTPMVLEEEFDPAKHDPDGHHVDGVEFGASLLCSLPDYHRTAYFEHLERVTCGRVVKQRHRLSGICHHMLFERKTIKALERLTARAWDRGGSEDGGDSNDRDSDDASSDSDPGTPPDNALSFWERFVGEVDIAQLEDAGASEFELLFNFVLQYRSRRALVRPLRWRNNLAQVLMVRSAGVLAPVVALDRIVELWSSGSPTEGSITPLDDTDAGVSQTGSFVMTSVGPAEARESDAAANHFSFSTFHTRDIFVPVSLLWLVRRLRLDDARGAKLFTSSSMTTLAHGLNDPSTNEAEIEPDDPRVALVTSTTVIMRYARIALLRSPMNGNAVPTVHDALLSALADAPELDHWAAVTGYDPATDNLLALVDQALIRPPPPVSGSFAR